MERKLEGGENRRRCGQNGEEEKRKIKRDMDEIGDDVVKRGPEKVWWVAQKVSFLSSFLSGEAPIQVCLSPSRRTKKEGEGGGGMDSKSTPILFLILAVWPGATIQPAHRQGWKQNPTFIALAKFLAAVHLNRTGFVLTSPHM